MRYITIVLILFVMTVNAQESEGSALPFSDITDHPDDYGNTSIMARMLDGLGFRYYWATEGLQESDLAYRTTEGARSLQETLEHVYNLSEMIKNAALQLPNDRRGKKETSPITDWRTQTLNNIKEAREAFANSQNLEDHTLIFISDRGEREFPLFNLINGPIEDAVWHVGQVVMLRRASGNPINPKANFFMGRLNK